MPARDVCLGAPLEVPLLDDMGGGIRIVFDGGLLEDILEVAEGLDGGFTHVGGS